AMQSRPAADRSGHADGVAAFHLVDVEHALVIDDAELHRLAGLFQQLAELRPRFIGNIHAPANERTELEERHPQPIFAGLAVLLEEARARQRRREPMHCALGEPQPCGERGDAELILLARERSEEPYRIRYG